MGDSRLDQYELWRLNSDRQRVPKSAMKADGLIQPEWGRVLLSILPFTGFLFVFGAILMPWYLLQMGWDTLGAAVFGILAAAFASFMTWLLAVSDSNLGMRFEGANIAVFEPLMTPGLVIKRVVPIGELRNPEVNPTGSNVVFRTNGFPVSLSRLQARALFVRPEYKGRDQIPPIVAERVGLSLER